jgi:hypothetical protein
MVARIDVSYNICPTNNQLSVTHSVGGGPTTLTLAAGRYMTAALLAAQLQTQLQTVHASFTCTESAGVYTISAGAGNTFSLTWTRPALRDFLGWSANVAAGTSRASGSVSPGVFTSSHPWYGDALGWEWSLKLRTDHRGGGSGYRIGKQSIWSVTAQMISSDERQQWLTVCRRMLKGEPFTWFRDSAVTSAWSYSNWTGTVAAVLHPETSEIVDEWLSSPHLDLFDVPLTFRVYTAGSASTVTDWASAVESDAVLGLRWYLKIGGIGHLFLASPAVPIGPTGSAWAAPTSSGVAYTISPGTLDVSGGVRDTGPEVDRRTGAVTTRAMQIVLKDEDGSTTINDLVAVDKIGGQSAEVTADIDYDTTGAGSVITVDTTSGWASSGLLYFGAETISYSATAAGTFGTPAAKASRGVFDLADADRSYTHEPDRIGPSVFVTDYPAVWHGRWASLHCYIVDSDGTAYDAAFDGDYSREVWRGVVQGDPTPAADWNRWSLRTRSIDQMLNTDVGGEYAKGTMLRFPGDYKQNEQGSATAEEYAAGKASYFYVDESVGNIHMTFIEYANAAAHAAGSSTDQVPLTAVVTTTGTILGVHGLRFLMNQALSVAIEAEYGTDPGIAIIANRRQHNLGGWGFTGRSTDAKVYVITLHMSREGSIGPLLGLSGDYTAVVSGTNDDIADTDDSTGPVGLYIGPAAHTIPFFYIDDNGTLPPPPTSGYARVGAEIVEYESITDLSGQVTSGLHQLNVTRRGALGTQALAHKMTINQNGDSEGNKTDIDSTEVVFGAGFNGVNPLHALLQLATSTGSGHHGTYDTLGAEVSVPINPEHFDTTAWERHADQLIGMQKKIHLFLSKPVRLSKLAADLLAPYGRHILARPNEAGEFLITVDELLPALESETSDYTVGSGNLAMVDPATFESGSDRLVTHVNVEWRWDVLEEQTTEDKAVLINRPGVVRYGQRASIDWQLIGQPKSSFGEIIAHLQAWAQQVFERHGKPYKVAHLSVGRIGWLLQPGDTIAFTLADVPTASGVRGYTGERAVVTQVSHVYQGGDMGVTRFGADVVVVIQPQGRASTYCPAAKIASYAAGTPSVTLEANEYTAAGGTEVDADHFENGDRCRIFNEGDEPGDNVVLSSKSGNVFTLDGTLSITPGANTYMVARPHNVVQADQLDHVFIADNSNPPVLSSGDTVTFVYV